MKNKNLFRFIIFVFIIFLVPEMIQFPVYSAGLLYDAYYPIEKNNTEISYSRYYDTYSGENRPEDIIEVSGSDYISAENGKFSVRENTLIWESSSGEVSYNTAVQETGIYCMNITYLPLKSETSSIEFSLSIDDKIPYDTASRITLNKTWVNEKEISTDSHGNQIRSTQVQKEMWKKSDIMDIDGLFSEPLIFYLEKGNHEIKFTSESACFAIEKFKFYNPEDLPTYKEYISGADIYSTPENIFRIEAENAVCKSDRTLYPTCDNSHYNVSPADPVKILYNTFGKDNWKKPLQSATWTIPKEDIKYDGWYKIGIKYRQNEIRGFSSNRRLYIDDKVPCQELNDIKFNYSKKWEILSPEVDNENIYIYLSADCDHTITLECITGEIGEYIRNLNEIISEINDYYRKILMITGASPDKYTDYYVHEKIPDLVKNFRRISSELKNIQSGIEKISDSSGSEAYVIENMTVILDKCVKKPLKIPEYLTRIKSDIITLSEWSLEFINQPLEIDYIEFATSGVDFTSCKENILKKIWFAICSFFGSFSEDYSALSDISGEDVIEVWVNSGREQAEIIMELSENFTEKTGIPVSVNLVTGGIVEASLAGKSPDIALFIGGEYPVNLAMRGLLADVSQFDDFQEITGRFQENAMTHYQYNGGVYGIPITQNFPLLFYRTDILTELGYNTPPETWDNLINMIPALQRNYMSAGLVLPSTSVSPSTETGNTFALLMLQRGINYYNSGLNKSNFDTVEATEAFEIWTDFYTKYSFEQSYDVFNRFRTGEYPLVIADCSFYGQLTDIAPELKNSWNFCPVLATVMNGEVRHTANSNVSGAVIFADTVNIDSAWKYVKWFTETETQLDLCNRTESLFGTMGRLYTANTEAFKKLSWSDDELSRLSSQRDELEEIPVIPASYSVTRNIINAFREVINRNQNPRDTILWYNNDINDEISRKNKNVRE
ncbi:MAG: extracellular solute-binding protein [Ruminococcus sp.]|nr:extracellular solute-binding protein [Ruminococcus sp.]